MTTLQKHPAKPVGKLRKPCRTQQKPCKTGGKAEKTLQNTAETCRKLAKHCKSMQKAGKTRNAPHAQCETRPTLSGKPVHWAPRGARNRQKIAQNLRFSHDSGRFSADFRPPKNKMERGLLLTSRCGWRNPPGNHCFREVFGESASGTGRAGRRQPAAAMAPARTWSASSSPSPVAMFRWWSQGASIYSSFPAPRTSWVSK